ncbi:MAG TPA: YciI family protein [Gemmatimonadales bacterium]
MPPPDIIYQEDPTMAEFIYLYRNSPASRKEHMGTPEAAQKSMQRWMAWMRDLETKGHLKSAGQPLEEGGKVVRGPAKAITDGPFVEAKDVIGGYSIIEARDIAEAAELAKGCPAVDGVGSVEIRPVMKMDF